MTRVGSRGSYDQNRPNSNRSGLGSNGGSSSGNNGFNPATSSNFVGEKFSLFVGGIAGIQDGWLERILEVSWTAQLMRDKVQVARISKLMIAFLDCWTSSYVEATVPTIRLC